MPATIQQRVHAAIGVTNDHDGRLPHGPRYEVAGLRDLSFVRQEYPGAIEDPQHLQPVDIVAHEDIATDQTALNIDPRRVRRTSGL